MNKSAALMAALHSAIILLAAVSSCDAAAGTSKDRLKEELAAKLSRVGGHDNQDDEQCSTPGSCNANQKKKAASRPCSLYLAPSSIPNAGLGIFSGRNIPSRNSVHEYLSFCEDEDDDVDWSKSTMWWDIFVPVWNRSGRPFASWMGYVWPASPGELWNEDANKGFDGNDDGLAFADGDVYLAEDGRRGEDEEGLLSPVSAFAPGLASLANSHPTKHNIERDTSLFDGYEQMENHKGLLGHSSGQAAYDQQVMLNAPWDAGVGAFAPNFGNDFLTTKSVKEGTELLLNYGKEWHVRHPTTTETPGKQQFDIVKSPEWLAENGICLFDNTITARPSRIPQAGRGAFTSRKVRKGEILAVSPLLAVARDDLSVTHMNGNQLLLNYAFGHVDSSVLLVPMAPVVSYINHSNKKANAEIRWPQAGSESDTQKLFGDPNNVAEEGGGGWLTRPPADVLKMSGKLALEYVALRDIKKGEEIVINYGEEWDQLWKSFARMHPYERPGYFPREIGVPDGFYPEAWLDLAE